MIRFYKFISSILAMSAVFFILAGCEKQGPAEKTGEKLDNAVAEAGEKIEEAGESVRDAVKGDE